MVTLLYQRFFFSHTLPMIVVHLFPLAMLWNKWIHAFSCALSSYDALGFSLESTQEARKLFFLNYCMPWATLALLSCYPNNKCYDVWIYCPFESMCPNAQYLSTVCQCNEKQTLSQWKAQLLPKQREQLIFQHLVTQWHPPPGSLFDQEGSECQK